MPVGVNDLSYLGYSFPLDKIKGTPAKLLEQSSTPCPTVKAVPGAVDDAQKEGDFLPQKKYTYGIPEYVDCQFVWYNKPNWIATCNTTENLVYQGMAPPSPTPVTITAGISPAPAGFESTPYPYSLGAGNTHTPAWDLVQDNDPKKTVYCYQGDTIPLLSNWTNFEGTDINNWDVSYVTNMTAMFHSASTFNGNVSKWNTHNVTSMSAMFVLTPLFDQDISSWDVSNVLDMTSMFSSLGTSNYNNNNTTDMNNWNTHNVTTMRAMFHSANTFNQDISKWNTHNVTNMYEMFYDASSFNQNIGIWNINNVTNMDQMLALSAPTAIFNQNLSSWGQSPMPEADASGNLKKNQGPFWNTIFEQQKGNNLQKLSTESGIITLKGILTNQTLYSTPAGLPINIANLPPGLTAFGVSTYTGTGETVSSPVADNINRYYFPNKSYLRGFIGAATNA